MQSLAKVLAAVVASLQEENKRTQIFHITFLKEIQSFKNKQTKSQNYHPNLYCSVIPHAIHHLLSISRGPGQVFLVESG